MPGAAGTAASGSLFFGDDHGSMGIAGVSAIERNPIGRGSFEIMMDMLAEH